MPDRLPRSGETSTTLQGVGPRRRQPVTPGHHEGRTMVEYTQPCPPSRVITKRRTRCQPNGRDSPSLEERAPQLTRRSTLDSHAPPPRRDETIGDGANRPLNPTSHVGRVSTALLCRTISDDVNTFLLQHATNFLNIIHIHAGNTDAALELTVTVLNNFELKRDTVQPENDLPAQ